MRQKDSLEFLADTPNKNRRSPIRQHKTNVHHNKKVFQVDRVGLPIVIEGRIYHIRALYHNIERRYYMSIVEWEDGNIIDLGLTIPTSEINKFIKPLTEHEQWFSALKIEKK